MEVTAGLCLIRLVIHCGAALRFQFELSSRCCGLLFVVVPAVHCSGPSEAARQRGSDSFQNMETCGQDHPKDGAGQRINSPRPEIWERIQKKTVL